MFNRENITLIALIFWIAVVVFYFIRTPTDVRSSDHWGQANYTKIIATEHRFPKPYEGWITYNPPLYYLVNSLIAPSYFKTNIDTHKNCVRVMSIVYGVLTLLITLWLVQQVSTDRWIQLLATLFVCTTPQHLIVFSTYNNDSLSTLLSVSTIALSYKLHKKWSNLYAFYLLLVSAAGNYTKHTFLWCVLTICIICWVNILRRGLSFARNEFKIILTLLLSLILLSPWLIFHNYRYSGKILPFNVESKLFPKKLTAEIIINNFKERMKVPILQESRETWKDPFVHPQGGMHSKKPNYWSMMFVHSIISTWSYDNPSFTFIYFLLLLHLFIGIVALINSLKSSTTKLAVFVIFVIHGIQISYYLTLNDCFDLGWATAYRYICWSRTCWAMLIANALLNCPLLDKILRIGIISNLFFLMTVTGSGW